MTTQQQINRVTTAIRDIERIDCDDVAQILSTLAAKMKDAGFSELDLKMVDEITDFVCGDQSIAA